MKTRYVGRFELHVCTEEPCGCGVMRFEVQYRWRIQGEAWRAEELVLNAESTCVLGEDDWRSVSIPLHYNRAQTKFRLGTGRRARWFRCGGTMPGGNWHWEVILMPAPAMAHVLNYLRGVRHQGARLFQPTEWDEEFRARIWERRGSIQVADLRRFGTEWVRSDRKTREADQQHNDLEA